MNLRQRLTASLVLLVAFCGHLFASGKAQANAPLNLTLKGGALQWRTGDGDIFTDIKLRLRLSDGAIVTGDLQLAGQDTARDEAGVYERFQYRLNPSASNQSAQAATFNAVLDVRHYLQPDVTVAALDYAGPALAARDGVQLLMHLDSFARGMALKRFKLYWTAPIFTSDYRFLPASNQMLLWQRTQGERYHLLAPLAGDNMISEIGVSDIDYRYEFRVAASSYAANIAPTRIPLFAYAASTDPYSLSPNAYRIAFASTNQ